MAEDNGPGGPERPGGPNSRWPPAVQFLVVAVLTLLFLLLAVSMRRHHFGSGEFYERNHPENR